MFFRLQQESSGWSCMTPPCKALAKFFRIDPAKCCLRRYASRWRDALSRRNVLRAGRISDRLPHGNVRDRVCRLLRQTHSCGRWPHSRWIGEPFERVPRFSDRWQRPLRPYPKAPRIVRQFVVKKRRFARTYPDTGMNVFPRDFMCKRSI